MRDEAVFRSRSVADCRLPLISFHSICVMFCEYRARCASCVLIFAGKKRARDKCVSRGSVEQKKRIIKNFPPQLIQKKRERERSFARRADARSWNKSHNGRDHKNPDRFDRGSARCRLVALYLPSTSATKARPFQFDDRKSRDSLEKRDIRPWITCLSSVLSCVVYENNSADF